MATPDQNQAVTPALQTLIQTHFGSLNLAGAPQLISDDQFVALQNAYSYDVGNLAVFPGPLELAAPPSGYDFSEIWGVVENGVSYIICQMTDGSLYAYDIVANTFALITTGTTVHGLTLTKWQGKDPSGNPEAVLFVDTTLGYASWDGTSWTILDDTMTGQAIAVYAGRVWIAIGSAISYTDPSSYNDFGDDGGAFTVSDPNMNGPVITLLASQDWLYIIGSSIMALNNVAITTVTGSSTTTTTFFVTLVASSIGITTRKAALCYDNTLLLVTDTGLYAYYGLTGQKISAPMGDNFAGDYYLSAAQVFGKTILFMDQGFCYVVEDNRWFNVSYSFSPWIAQDTLIFDGLTGYVATASALYKFGADTATQQDVYIHTKLFDAGNAVIDKVVTQIGVEFFQNELVIPANSPAPFSLSWRADGFIRSSSVFSHDNVDGTVNQFLANTLNLKDRYFSLALSIAAYPGTSISGFFFRFKDSTPWPSS